MKPLSIAICFTLQVSFTAYAQQPSSYLHTAPPSDRFPARWYHDDGKESGDIAPYSGHPFTATVERSSQDTFLLAGTVVSESAHFLKARDSTGRTRDEEQLRTQQDRPANGKRIIVMDPVAHCAFFWIESADVAAQPIATVYCSSHILRYTVMDIDAGLLAIDEQTRTIDGSTNHCERLGKREFSGVEAQGILCTMTDEEHRSDRIARIETETWIAPELRELVRQRHETDDRQAADPHKNIDETSLTDIRRTEPDASLFYPPAGYRILPTATLIAAMSPELQTLAPSEPAP